MGRKKFGIPGVSFSWKRAVGITSAKRKFAKATGIPTTRSGRQRKVGQALGCMLPLLAIVFLLCVIVVTALAQRVTFIGEVVSVVDGNTINVKDGNGLQHLVRLQSIDVPEDQQEYGPESTAYLSNLLLGKTVTVDYEGTDVDGRMVAKILSNGSDIGLHLITSGYAWYFKGDELWQVEAERKAYRDAEKLARQSHLGLWAVKSPVAPWDYRRRHVTSTVTPSDAGKTVNVKGYYRKDGTYVRPHTRSAPRKKN